jgi:hypothetical protein
MFKKIYYLDFVSIIDLEHPSKMSKISYDINGNLIQNVQIPVEPGPSGPRSGNREIFRRTPILDPPKIPRPSTREISSTNENPSLSLKYQPTPLSPLKLHYTPEPSASKSLNLDYQFLNKIPEEPQLFSRPSIKV